MGERLAGMAIQFAVSIFVIRYLGPEGFGQYSYALSTIGILLPVATMGLDPLVMRELAAEKHPIGAVWGTAFALRAAAAAVAAALSLGVAWTLIESRETLFIAYCALAQLAFMPGLLCETWFSAHRRARLSVRAKLGAVLSGALMQVVLMWVGAELFWFGAVTSVRAAILLVLLLWLLRQSNVLPMKLLFDRQLAKTLLSQSWPLLLAGLLVSIYQKIDQVMLGKLSTPHALGQYATAARFSELFYFLPTAIAASAFPALVHAKTKLGDPAVYYARFQRFYDGMALLGIGVAVPGYFAAEIVLGTLLGPEFTHAAHVFQVHIWSFIVVCMGVARGQWLVAEGLTRVSLWAALVGAVSNVGLNWLWIPSHGAIGAAWATLLSYMAATFGTSFAIPQLRPTARQMMIALAVPFRILKPRR